MQTDALSSKKKVHSTFAVKNIHIHCKNVYTGSLGAVHLVHIVTFDLIDTLPLHAKLCNCYQVWLSNMHEFENPSLPSQRVRGLY